MQAATHMAVGALVAGVIGARALAAAPVGAPARAAGHLWARLAAAAALAALAHPLLDDLARATYHPADPRPDDGFWLGYHLLVAIAALAIAWRYRAAWPALAGSLAPDLDWIVGRPFGAWEPGALHAWFRGLPGIAQASGALRELVPDWTQQPVAALAEVALLAGCVLLAERIVRRPPRGAAGEP